MVSLAENKEYEDHGCSVMGLEHTCETAINFLQIDRLAVLSRAVCCCGDSVSFGGAASMYSHEAIKTIMVPGSTRNDISVSKRIGDR